MMFLHHTGPAAPWSLVPSIKSHNSPGLCGLYKARGWYIGTVVGVETWEEWQTFSLMVIDVEGASECCGESTPCLIYVWDSPCRALLGEYRGGRKNSLCWGWMNAVRYSENSKRCWRSRAPTLDLVSWSWRGSYHSGGWRLDTVLLFGHSQPWPSDISANLKND